jgi:hypothetical protein
VISVESSYELPLLLFRLNETGHPSRRTEVSSRVNLVKNNDAACSAAVVVREAAAGL